MCPGVVTNVTIFHGQSETLLECPLSRGCLPGQRPQPQFGQLRPEEPPELVEGVLEGINEGLNSGEVVDAEE
jgi:hypothetical protein